MSTKGSGGKRLKKTVKVLTDDPDNSEIPLIIAGRVMAVYSLSPKSVKLVGIAGDKIQATVRLVPNKDYPFTVEKVTAKEGDNIRFQLKKIKDAKGIQYELAIENTKTDPGVYFDVLKLKTDSETKPQIDIKVTGRIKAAATEAE